MKEPSVGASNLDILSDTVMDGAPLNDVSLLHETTGTISFLTYVYLNTFCYTFMVLYTESSKHLFAETAE